MNELLQKLGITLPIIQAPMAGVSTPRMAAAVSNAGGLGSLGVGNLTADQAREKIAATRALTGRPFHVNVFCHRPARPDPARESAWIEHLRPHFATYGARPPSQLREIYTSFQTDDAMLAMLLEERSPVMSFHFGLPPRDRLDALRRAGITLLASATNLAEARTIHAAGIDAVIAQGYEAGGHRGVFDPDLPDDRIGCMALTRLLVKELPIPVIASGGIMDGAAIAAALTLGAGAALLGTAFIACPESAADAGYRAALLGSSAEHTTMTRAISGRPARSLVNRFTALGEAKGVPAVPDYPIAYDAGKALHAAASTAGEAGYGAQWAGQGAPLSRSMPAAELIALLNRELNEALAS